MSVRWSPRARRDLIEIGRYIARDDRRAARRWVSRLQARAEAASSAPLAGRVVPELGNPAVREVLLRNYRIVYLVLEGCLQVLTVFEGHRLFPGDLA